MAIMLVRQVLVMTGVLLSAVHAEPNAGTIHLKCSGTFFSDYGKQPIHGAVTDETFTVDFDNDVVSGFWPRDYPIASVDDEKIEFSMDILDPDKLKVNAHGTINRMTGKTMIFAIERNHNGALAFLYDLMCVPARQLF